MKRYFKFQILALSAMMMSFASCSDEPDEPTQDSPEEPKVENVFPAGVPASVNGTTITTNDGAW